MAKISVFHPDITVNAGRTDFNGSDVRYLVTDDGSLRVMGWETNTERGEATFAAGKWGYVCRSTEKS